MKNGRNLAVAAAAACALSGALTAAAQPAQADELSDLRANNDLLQQRVDQLAQARVPGNLFGVGGPAGPTNVTVAGGSFPRSFLIPGTDTSLRVGGQITEIADYYLTGGNPNQGTPWSTTVGDNGQLLSIPLNFHPGQLGFSAGAVAARDRSNSIFGTSPRETRITIESRTPTPLGEARTFMQFDWAGSTSFAPGGGNPTSVSDNLHPRLRYAYGTLGGFLAGQANSNFADPDASAETIDFGGNMGDPGVVRIPQIRYTTPLAPWGLLGAFSVSAETPETDVTTAIGLIASDATNASPAGSRPAGSFNPTKTPAPDLTAAWYIPQPWGHLDVSLVLRPTLQVKDGLFVDRTFTGYGGHIGFDVKPGWFGWSKDDITFHAVGGDAIGRYVNCSCGFSLVTDYPAGLVTSAATAAALHIHPTREYAGNIGYRHYWAPNLRSTISGGIWFHDIDRFVLGSHGAGGTLGTPGLAASLNKELFNAHINLIWNPVSFVDLGVEYTYGHRVVVSNAKGDMNVVIGEAKFRF